MKVNSGSLPQPLNIQNVTLESPINGKALLETELKNWRMTYIMKARLQS